MKLKKTATLFFLVAISLSLKAQITDFLPKITPPSPTAFALGNYGNIPVGLFTGASNIEIPIMEYKTKNISVPIKLFYGSNGLKVDEISGNVGLGWNMNFGGVVTRTVRDLADENQLYLNAPDDISGGPNNAAANQFFYEANMGADTEHDIYSFSFNGNSGKFVFDKNNNPVLLNQQKLKIERYVNGTVNGFLITDTDGVQYYFYEEEDTMFRTIGAGHSVPDTYPTAWHLSKIVHPLGDEVYFTYGGNGIYYTATNSQSLSFPYPFSQSDCDGIYNNVPTLSGIVSQTMRVIGKQIVKINSNNPINGEIDFSYINPGTSGLIDANSNKVSNISQFDKQSTLIEKVDFNYLNTANNRNFLQSISFKDPNKIYSFEYINPTSFPARLSTSQDHWGFYNGVLNNTNIVPGNLSEYGLDKINYNGANKEPNGIFTKTGMLFRIHYPTTGFSEFEYEPNTYYGTQIISPPIVEADLSLSTGIDGMGSINTQKSIFSYNAQTIKITGSTSFDSYNCTPDLNTNHNKGVVSIFCLEDNTTINMYQYNQIGTPANYFSSYSFTPSTSNTPIYFDAQANKTYTVTLTAYSACTNTSCQIFYTPTAPTTQMANIETGGVRIKSTKDYDTSSSPPIYKRYYYAPKSDLTHSSGNKGYTPYYIDLVKQRHVCTGGDGLVACVYVDVQDLKVSSSSMLSLFDTGNSNCFYSDVTISNGGDNFENGGESKKFIIHRDYWGNLVCGSNTINSAPWTNFGWDNGLEINNNVFKVNSLNQFISLKDKANTYKLEDAYTQEIKSYAVRQNCALACGAGNIHSCTTAETSVYSTNPCYGKATGTQVYLNDVNNLDIMEYKNISYWHYLNQTTETQYDLNGLNPVTTITNYIYNNPNHLQLTSQTTTNSTGETLETKHFYPQDMLGDPNVNTMITKNMIAIPLDTQVYKGITKLSEQHTIYGNGAATANLLLPINVYSAKFPNTLTSITIPNVGQLENKVTYDLYDTNGSLLQYTPESGTPVSIIWGYNKTQPIAKIENAIYLSIPTATITNLQSLSDADNDNCITATCKEQLLRNGLNALRSSLASNTLVTTYTYNPLIGITSITDPKGLTTYYEYDGFNRLKFTKDQDLNILQRNCYNYKGQMINCADLSSTTVITFNSVAKSGAFTKNSCAAGGVGSTVTYTVAAGAYTSTLSQADADTKAQTDVTNNGQNYANTNGTCTLVAPTAPTGLAISLITSTSLTLNWGASIGTVANYTVYKNAVLIATLGNVLTYNVTGLTASTAYNFTVYAKDAAGNTSAVSNTASATTPATSDTIAPSIPAITSSSRTSTPTVIINWTGSTDNVGVTGYQLWRDVNSSGTFSLIANPNTSPYTDGSIIAGVGNVYSYKMRARDAAGNWSAYSTVKNQVVP